MSSSTRSRSWIEENGLVRNASAPTARQRSSSSGSSRAVRMTTLTLSWSRREHTSTPSTPGIMMSSTTTDGFLLAIISSACSPSSASTTVRTRRLIISSSSTTRTTRSFLLTATPSLGEQSFHRRLALLVAADDLLLQCVDALVHLAPPLGELLLDPSQLVGESAHLGVIHVAEAGEAAGIGRGLDLGHQFVVTRRRHELGKAAVAGRPDPLGEDVLEVVDQGRLVGRITGAPAQLGPHDVEPTLDQTPLHRKRRLDRLALAPLGADHVQGHLPQVVEVPSREHVVECRHRQRWYR